MLNANRFVVSNIFRFYFTSLSSTAMFPLDCVRCIPLTSARGQHHVAESLLQSSSRRSSSRDLSRQTSRQTEITVCHLLRISCMLIVLLISPRLLFRKGNTLNLKKRKKHCLSRALSFGEDQQRNFRAFARLLAPHDAAFRSSASFSQPASLTRQSLTPPSFFSFFRLDACAPPYNHAELAALICSGIYSGNCQGAVQGLTGQRSCTLSQRSVAINLLAEGQKGFSRREGRLL